MANHFLAFDLGAESGRALLGTLNDGQLSLKEIHRFANANGFINGQLQWDLLRQWEELKTGLRLASAEQNTRLDGIGIDTWGVDFGLLTEDGALLSNPVCYRDSRTDKIMPEVFSRVSKSDIYAATGIQPSQINTLYHLLALKKQSPKILAAAAALLFMPDLFGYLFTGKIRAEFSIASTSQMFDMQHNRWATGLLEKLGLPTKILPPVTPSGTMLGPVQPTVAEECALKSEVAVISVAGHDTASAVAAVPAANDSWCYISSGTWSLMGVELEKPIITDESLNSGYTNEGGMNGSIRFQRNIMGLWLVQECRRYWTSRDTQYTYTELTNMAAQAKSTALIDTDYQPFLSPGKMVRKIDDFCRATGQPPPTTPGEYVRTCLESLALTYCRTLNGLEKILGRKIETIHIVGGGSQNELLNQMTADASRRLVVAGPVEATAIGNILIQAMAVGAVKSLSDARTVVRNSFDVKTFEPRDSEKWAASFERFSKIIQTSPATA